MYITELNSSVPIQLRPNLPSLLTMAAKRGGRKNAKKGVQFTLMVVGEFFVLLKDPVAFRSPLQSKFGGRCFWNWTHDIRQYSLRV